MIAKILLTLFLVGMVVAFIWTASRPPPEIEEPDIPDVDITSCPRTADPDDCRYYYDCIGTRYECGIMELFDANTNQCRQFYYDVDCGDRPRPIEPTVEEVCYPYVFNLLPPLTHWLPSHICNEYIDCNRDPPLRRCAPGLYFDDVLLQCNSGSNLCGNRPLF